MAATALTDRYAANLHGVLSCYDRIIVTGTLPGACYAGGMTSFLYSRGIRIFDYPRLAEPLRDRIRERAQQVCADASIEIEHVNKSHIRKEDLVARVLARRGDTPGLVHVISAMAACASYKPWLDKSNGHVYLRPDSDKCLHYYFYFIDQGFGLCYLRVPTWAPFPLQFYCNGHSALARSLQREGIDFVQEDNAFLRIADLARAQALADAFNPEQLHRCLTRYAHWLCPVAEVFAQNDWHWSIRQAEYSTDLMFRSQHILRPLYDAISRQAVLAADAPRVAGFLGKKITPSLAQELGSRPSTRIEGRCIKHYMGAAGVKAYDKFSRVLRVETTVNDVSFFKHHRRVEHKGAPATRELAPLKKSIYSLIDLREILLGCNQRYLAFLSSLDDPSAGECDLQRLSQPRVGTPPSVKGLNFFNATDRQLLCTLQHGEFNIHGWRRADLVARLPMPPSAMSRQLRRLHTLGVIKKVTHTYRYYLTRLGRAAIAAACSLTRFSIVPAMAAAH
ncbi:MAG: winged helix-turn-helix transcriptional regulator [Burkholderiales bacterium]|nr:winged helix-turn-helix transcriptional regulator [Burkholderiales bacterium]